MTVISFLLSSWNSSSLSQEWSEYVAKITFPHACLSSSLMHVSCLLENSNLPLNRSRRLPVILLPVTGVRSHTWPTLPAYIPSMRLEADIPISRELFYNVEKQENTEGLTLLIFSFFPGEEKVLQSISHILDLLWNLILGISFLTNWNLQVNGFLNSFGQKIRSQILP